jgi:hypothetical protein
MKYRRAQQSYDLVKLSQILIGQAQLKFCKFTNLGLIKSLTEGRFKVLTELILRKKFSFCETFEQIRIMRMRKMRKCEQDFYDANAMRCARL